MQPSRDLLAQDIPQGNEGSVLEASILSTLLGEDMQSRGIPQGQAPQWMAGMHASPEGSLPSINDERLMGAMQETGGGADPKSWGTMRRIMESRHSDDVARGRKEGDDPVGDTTAKKETSWNPLQPIINALGGGQ